MDLTGPEGQIVVLVDLVNGAAADVVVFCTVPSPKPYEQMN